MKLVVLLVLSILLINSVIAGNFDKEIKIARNAYPDLDNISIKFIEKSFNGRMMLSRPSMNFLFRDKDSREYEVWINNDFSKNSGYLIYNTTFNATVGLLSHELGHILEYSKMSKLGIIWMGIRYSLSDNYKRGVEHRVDELTISKGMGYEIYNFTSLVLKDSKSPEKYKKYRREIYYDPIEMLKII